MTDDIVTQLEWLHSEFYDVDSVTSIVELAKAEIKRLRAAGDALYELISVRLVIPADQHDDAVEQIRKWKEARRG